MLFVRTLRFVLAIAILALAAEGQATQGVRGTVRGAGITLPGAEVIVKQGSKKFQQTSWPSGTYSFPQASSGTWTLSVTMTGFVPVTRTVAAPATVDIDLRIAPLSAMPALAAAASPAPPQLTTRAAGALVIRGSESNAAASSRAQSIAFGNARPSRGSLFNGGIAIQVDSSAFDARSYSLTGEAEPRPHYSDTTESFQLGGPVPIGSLWGEPTFYVAYQRSRADSIVATPALVPTAAQRAQTSSPQAAALLKLYPLPNLASHGVGGGQYNFQTNVPFSEHGDSVQSHIELASGSDVAFGELDMRSTRSDNANLFGFDDRSADLGLNATVAWRHEFTPLLDGTFEFKYTRLRTRMTPWFASRENIEGDAGIAGADATPANWGPPTLRFSGGLAALDDGLAQNNRNQTATFSFKGDWGGFARDLEFGAQLNRLEFNLWQQQNPRGTFLFNGNSTGTDVGDFLAGRPDAVSLAWGNADKYFRQWTSGLFLNGNWHRPSFTLTAGVRWDDEEPMRERYGRLVNLALAPGFASAAPVISAGGGLQPYQHELQPRLGIAWTPWSESSVVLRAGYGVYYDTSVYLSLAEQMAQQAPLSRSLSVTTTAAAPLMLATALTAATGAGTTLFAVSPGFRPGYAQTWNASAQADVGGGNVLTLTYNGVKGTHAVQRSYPNTFAPGSPDPCPACPAGFLYETSNGNSTREAATVQLKRRLHHGLALTVAYTYAHAMDDAALGGGEQQTGPVIAQNWRNLDAERARSDFDQRHLLKLTAQWSTGFGPHQSWPHWLRNAWRNWTVTTQVTAGSGLPLTPTIAAILPRTSYAGLRPDLTGADPEAAPPGLFLNPAAYAAPAAGAWGDAGRNSANGPSEFDLDAGLQRQFHTIHGFAPTFHVQATNALNHVSYSGLDAVVGSSQFGLPLVASPMRRVTAVLRFAF